MYLNDFKKLLKLKNITYNENNILMVISIIKKSIEQKWSQNTYNNFIKQVKYYIYYIDTDKIKEKTIIGYNYDYLHIIYEKTVIDNYIFEFENILIPKGLRYTDNYIILLENIIKKSIEQKWNKNTLKNFIQKANFYTCIIITEKSKFFTNIEINFTANKLKF